ncbi:transcriptional regulator [Streptomyces sp. R-74717]|uniref:transcriptional regulator n=1 Tax=Streptomyces TaxID=1883 RepID=UPI0037A8B4B5
MGAVEGICGEAQDVRLHAGALPVGRRVRGGTEQCYRRTVRRIVVAEPQEASTAAVFAAVAQELDRSPAETYLTLRHLRLSPAKAQQLGETLARLVDEAEEDARDQPVHGVLVALYQQAGPTTGTRIAAGRPVSR